MAVPYYLKVARAADLAHPGESLLYRLLEMLPGALAWGAFLFGLLGAWLFPVWTAAVLIVFVLFWLFRFLYLAFHLAAAYRQMRKNEKADWMEILQKSGKNWEKIWHLVVIPAYQEQYEILEATLRSLAGGTFPAERVIVAVGFEERARDEMRQTADRLQAEFKDAFPHLLVTWHPDGLPGEIPGKGSNEAWIEKRAKEELIDNLGLPYENVAVTMLDADTVVYPQYLACLTAYYLDAPNPVRTAFQPVPLFLNNIWSAPAVSRVFSFNSTFWHMMNQQRPERLVTFSSHSMSFRALVDVGFQQPNVVSEDSRIFWQCLLYYEGDYRTQPVFYPVSMDANAAPKIRQTLRNIYFQQRRWAYGSENIAYSLFGFFKKRGKISLWKALSYEAEHIFGFWSWATASLMIFFFAWLPLLIGGEAFSETLASYNLPRFVSVILRISMVGILGSMFLTLLLVPTPELQSRKSKLFLALQWFLLPFIMVFTSLPALESQTRLMLGKYLGFWSTPKFRPILDEGAPAAAQRGS